MNDFLKNAIKSQASFVEYGYGQVEPNHLSAQATGQIYAQLPAKADINVLENGQFVKYNYAEGVVDFAGPGEWMLVLNEIKLYRDTQTDCEFAMVKGNYNARVYSPAGAEVANPDLRSRDYRDIVAPADIYSVDATIDPYHIDVQAKPVMMKDGTKMVPRVLKTNVGDIFTTNTINADALKVGDVLTPAAADGILAIGEGDMNWQVVKVYTMPDGQKGAKIMRIK